MEKFMLSILLLNIFLFILIVMMQFRINSLKKRTDLMMMADVNIITLVKELEKKIKK